MIPKNSQLSPPTHHSQQPELDLMHVHEEIKIDGLHVFYELAYKAAQEDFKNRINMADFSNRKDLQNDMTKVMEKLAHIRATCIHGTEEEKMAIVQSDVFEHMLHKHISEAAWFGKETRSILPSVFDDLFRGVDLILEQHVGRGAFAFSTLAIDATFSAKGAIQKLENTTDYLSKGKMGGIKYFKSNRANITGTMESVPHFVIGMGRPALFHMTSEYVQKGVTPDINQEARRMVLEQIIVQAEYFRKLLKNKGYIAEAEKYERVGIETSALINETSPLSNKKGLDEVHEAILNFCSDKNNN